MHLGKVTPILRIFDGYQQQLLAKDYRYAKPQVEETPWGSREMSIKDPFGNRLVFVKESEG
jgi:uncharacterized glyoxalase superfamily protein PhnB